MQQFSCCLTRWFLNSGSARHNRLCGSCMLHRRRCTGLAYDCMLQRRRCTGLAYDCMLHRRRCTGLAHDCVLQRRCCNGLAYDCMLQRRYYKQKAHLALHCCAVLPGKLRAMLLHWLPWIRNWSCSVESSSSVQASLVMVGSRCLFHRPMHC